MPDLIWRQTRHLLLFVLNQLLDVFKLTAGGRSDFSNPLPYAPDLERNRARWDRPSCFQGISYDLDNMKSQFQHLVNRFGREFDELDPYGEISKRGLGWGYPELDAMLLYFMIRELKPRSYIEVGSGMSTYYSSLALARNRQEGHGSEAFCIEPNPFPALQRLSDIRLIVSEVQNVDISVFRKLGSDDVLFIDSSHVVKIDGDVPFLYLEVLPQLQEGVCIHSHDVPFPYNTPYPADFWILNSRHPMFWNEAMLLQSFLSFNSFFKITMSLPLIRYHDEKFLATTSKRYRTISEQPNTFSSLWFRRVG